MTTLRLVSLEGLRASESSSTSDIDNNSCRSASHDEKELDAAHLRVYTPELEVQHSRHSSQQSITSSQPVIMTLEPTDSTIEERMQYILCQKVLILAAQLFPAVDDSKDLQVEHVGSGSFHDVVGFTVPTLKRVPENADGIDSERFSVEEEKYVVRIPRADVTHHSLDMRRNIAILRGLEGRLEIPISRVITFETDTQNALDAPYTLELRLRGRSLEDLVGNDVTNDAQNVHMFKQVVPLIEALASVTAPYAGLISDDFGKGIDARLCASRIPIKMFEFPFDASSLTQLADKSPLSFMLELADLWVQYEHEHCPEEDNFGSWNKIKGILRSLQRRDVLGDAFHLSHGDLASRNILAEVVDDDSIEITGVVDWDFASFAPIFCAYKAPMDMWSGGENVAIEECTATLVKIFKGVASPKFVRYAFSVEAKIGRKIWHTLRNGMVDEDQRWFATNSIWEWERLHPEDKI